MCWSCAIFLCLGGRGYHSEVWDYAEYNVHKVRTQFNSTYPVPSKRSTEYGTQELRKHVNFKEVEYNAVGAKWKGFLKPPYSGMFHVLINADDLGEVWLSKDGNNRHPKNLVRNILLYISSDKKNSWKNTSECLFALDKIINTPIIYATSIYNTDIINITYQALPYLYHMFVTV